MKTKEVDSNVQNETEIRINIYDKIVINIQYMLPGKKQFGNHNSHRMDFQLQSPLHLTIRSA